MALRLLKAGGPALWADYISDAYRLGDLLLRSLITFKWTHLVIYWDADLMRVNRRLPRVRGADLVSASLRQHSLSKAFR